MYTLLRESLQRAGVTARRDPQAPCLRPRVSPTVVALGFTSLFTDISSEMVNAVLPLYFLIGLHFTPFAFGVIDGLNQGAAALVSLLGGLAADRWRRYKSVAAAGYGLSASARLGLLLAGGRWTVLTGVIAVDRIGKGIRTAPRDALIAFSSEPQALGVAFGVHRALDTLGAILGPMLAFAILDHTRSDFTSVFVASCCAALLGLAVIVLFVERDPARVRPAHRCRPRAARPAGFSWAGVLALVAAPQFGLLLVLATALSLATISDSFLYLVLQRGLHLSLGLFPLLYVGTSLAYFVLAVPAGWLADRVGSGRVFVGGYGVLLLVYTAVLRGAFSRSGFSAGVVLLYLGLYGAYYAATDGVLRAHASALLPAALQTSGLGLLTTTTSAASLLGSVLFGALWTWRGPQLAVLTFCVALSAATLLGVLYLVRTGVPTAYPEQEVRHG